MRFFKKKGEEPENNENKDSTPPEKLNIGGMEINVVAVGPDGIQGGLPSNMPPEIQQVLQNILGQIMSGRGNEDCDCPPGHPGCSKTTLDQLVEWVRNFNVRVHKDVDDPEVTYYADADITLALLAAYKLAGLGMEKAGLDADKRVFAKKVFLNITQNALGILDDDDRAVDLSNQEIPDTIPADWKTD